MFTIKCKKLIIFVVICQADSVFLCVSGDNICHICKYNTSMFQNTILLLTPMCQDTPCQISGFYVYLCNFGELNLPAYNFARAIYQKWGFWDSRDILTPC